ncbi:WD repeat-containing protein 91 [Lepeophtheirus salmonis]|uniref:WD repeat-containing protein 91 n=1 Tax=Lepeophtheirus salmonis TaxID=72036 RepID=UPI001AE54925|nr:WD repeat-containing protein 91-like [Lepeophtheirus salmonis]
MAQYGFIDDLIKEYLLFRGFSSTLKTFELELKTEKEKGFRVDRLVDQFLSMINNHDLHALKELWSHLSTRYFSRLDPARTAAANRLETSLLKLYLVSCVQTRHSDKVKEFFDKMTPEIQGMSEWKEWFALPFIKNPEEVPTFAPFFSRTWQDTLILSLFNFLSILYSCLPPPRIAEFQNTSIKLRKLREDNEAMRRKILSFGQKGSSFKDVEELPFRATMSPPHVMDDFYIIAQEAPTSNNPSSKSLKSFLKNFTTPSSSQSQVLHPQKTVPLSTKSSPNGSVARKRSSSKTRHVPVRRVAAMPSVHQTEFNVASALMDDALKEPLLGGGLAYLPLSHGEFVEHRSEVTQVKFSSSGRIIISGDVDGIIKVWSPSPEDPQTLSTFISPSGITALDWVGNSEKNFVYGTTSGLIRICDHIDRSSVVDFQSKENGSIFHLTSSLSGSVFAVSSVGHEKTGSSYYIYDMKVGKVKNDFISITPTPTITCSAFNHNTTLSITGGMDGKIRVFDLRKNDCLSSWSVKDASPITSLQLSADENTVYVLTQDGYFSQWSLAQTGSKLSEQMLQDSYFNEGMYPRSAWGKQFAIMGKHLLCCSISGGVIYEKTPTLVKVLGLKGHESHATCVDWSGAGDGGGPCITADANGRVRGWTLLSR